jgi:hypothetical protein
VGQIDHHRPTVYQPLAKSLLGTGPRFDPLEFDSGPLGCIAHDFHAETGKAASGANLIGGLFSKPMRRGRVGTYGTERGSTKAREVPRSLPLRRSRWPAPIGLKFEESTCWRRRCPDLAELYMIPFRRSHARWGLAFGRRRSTDPYASVPRHPRRV